MPFVERPPEDPKLRVLRIVMWMLIISAVLIVALPLPVPLPIRIAVAGADLIGASVVWLAARQHANRR
jgi:hypothetical protein